MPGTLYLVGTPIGNLGDMSPRGLQTLRDADFIAAEDTRVTAKLLAHFDIRRPVLSYHEHNARASGARILARLLSGESAALVTDAGMPAISDPGEALVAACREAGVPVACAPGPSALVSALALSGFPAGRFCFEGFLSVNRRSRREHLESLRGEKRTMIFYEAPHKLLFTLCDLLDTLGDRDIAIARELTKIHEEVVRTTLAEAAARVQAEPFKGEIVLIVAGAPETEPAAAPARDAVALRVALDMVTNGMSLSDAAKFAAEHWPVSRNEIYREILEIKSQQSGDKRRPF